VVNTTAGEEDVLAPAGVSVTLLDEVDSAKLRLVEGEEFEVEGVWSATELVVPETVKAELEVDMDALMLADAEIEIEIEALMLAEAEFVELVVGIAIAGDVLLVVATVTVEEKVEIGAATDVVVVSVNTPGMTRLLELELVDIAMVELEVLV
jgi:hypothetical protein